MTTDVLQICDLSYKKNDRTVFDHLNLSLRKGEVHAMMSGRVYDLTNFCDLVAGAFDFKGCVNLNGQSIGYRELNRHFYSVTTGNGLFHDFSIPQNLYINAILMRKQEQKQTEEVFRWLGIPINPKTRVKNLSGSERKLLEVVRGYTNQCDIMLLHDTLYHIDNPLQSLTISVIRHIAESGISILYLTSKLEDALMVSDRISVVENGCLIGCFDTAQVRQSPKHMMMLLAGMDAKNVDNQEMLDVISALVNTREIIESSTELRDKIKQYTDNIIRFAEADGCLISVVDTNGSEIAIESSNSVLIPQKLAKRLSMGLWKIKAFPKNEIESPNECPFSLLVSIPIGGKDLTSPYGYIFVGYNSEEKFSPRNQLLLASFAKDVQMTLETSRLKNRSLLLQESNHRIKNNLQMIVSLLYMQKQNLMKAENLNADSVSMLIYDIISRIKSIAVVHETLTNNGEQNSSIVFLSTIIDGIANLYKDYAATITINVEQILLKYDKATFIALIVNELLNNCIKHAFRHDDIANNQIDINCRDFDTQIEISARDNGVGIDEGWMNDKKNTSAGLQIIRLATDSLNGKVEYHNLECGTDVRVQIPKENLI